MIAQIYEIQSPHEAERCISLGVDHLGSVLLSEGEWRKPLIKEVIRISEEAGVKNSLIPLFHREETLYRAIDYYHPSFLHFCDTLTDEQGIATGLEQAILRQVRVREKFPSVGIMRSIPVPTEGAAPHSPVLALARALEPVTDIFLIDTWLGKEPVEGYIGITGKPVDWTRARQLVLASSIPVILAGGLSPDNVYEALLKVMPFGADSCTRTNRMDSAGRPLDSGRTSRK